MATGPLVVMTRPRNGSWSLHVDPNTVRIEDVTISVRPDLSMNVKQKNARTRSVKRGELFDLPLNGVIHDAVCFVALDERKSPDATVKKALEAMRASDSEDARRVLSDVLEESGAVAEAQYVRHELKLQAMKNVGTDDFVQSVRELRALSKVVGPTFRYLVGRDIEGCAGVRWAFRCPKQWDDMKRTAEERERVCMSCRQLVVQVTTETDAEKLAKDGVCAQVRVEPIEEMWVGEMAADPEPNPQWVGSVAVRPPFDPPTPTPSEPPVKDQPKKPWWKRLLGR